MSLSVHVLCRVYGVVEGQPPFQNASGQANFSRVKQFPVAPNTYVPTNNLTIWPLPNGFNVGVQAPFYVYSVLELPPAGLNTQGVKLVTDKSASTLATDAS